VDVAQESSTSYTQTENYKMLLKEIKVHTNGKMSYVQELEDFKLLDV
jgi:hypothetical protein